MLRNTILSLGSLAALAVTATAQDCAENLYPIHLTNAQGVPAPVFLNPPFNTPTAQFQSEAVYLAFDPALPSGTYYVHVTDSLDGNDVVLSTNDPMDRFVSVTNTNGVITVSLPYSSNQSPVLGLGLNGQGQSLALFPFTTSPAEPCHFTAWLSNNWDLTYGPDNPYLIKGGIHPVTNECSIFSYRHFRIGDGTGTDVAGDVFLDSDRDGERDPGEAGLAGWQVRLVTSTTSETASTDGNGHYTFANVAAANYTVELVVQSGHLATTTANVVVEACGCADVAVAAFGVATQMLACDGHTIGFWRNHHGLALVQQRGMLATLPALGIVNLCGQRVAPGNLLHYKLWLQFANSCNMAYMLSAQLVAMHNNVLAGFVDPDCVVNDPDLGQVTVAQLMQQASLSLWAHPLTFWCSPHRNGQAKLKNALDRANNNQNWL